MSGRALESGLEMSLYNFSRKYKLFGIVLVTVLWFILLFLKAIHLIVLCFQSLCRDWSWNIRECRINKTLFSAWKDVLVNKFIKED